MADTLLINLIKLKTDPGGSVFYMLLIQSIENIIQI